MFVKILGVLDLLSSVSIILLQFNLLVWNLAFGFATYMIVKGFIFRDSITSVLDIASGVYMILMFIGLKWWLAYFFAGYLLQKGLFSLF